MRLTFIVLLLLLFGQTYAQSRTVKKAQKNAEKVELQEERTYQKSKDKAIKRHYNNQSERTKSSMDRSKSNSDRYRKQQKDGFLKAFLKNRKNKREQKKRSNRQKRK